MGKVFQKPYTVTYYDCDVFSQMKLSSLTNICMYYSGLQSKELGRGDDYVHQLGFTWVVTDYEMDVIQMPKMADELMIFTEAISYNKFFCSRDFWVEDLNGNRLMTVHAVFCLMDRKNRKMARVFDELLLPYASEKINKITRFSSIPVQTNSQSETFRVRFSELDANNHVNNTKYIEWILDVLDIEFRKKYSMKKAHFRFVKEIEYGTTIESLWEERREGKKHYTIHHIHVNQKNHFEAEIEWEERNAL